MPTTSASVAPATPQRGMGGLYQPQLDGLRALGASIEAYPDGFQLEARPLSGTSVDAAGDHRLAV